MHLRWIRSLLWLAVTAVLAFSPAGCTHRTSPGSKAGSGNEFVPQNFRQDSAWLPRDFRRVAVLPLTTATDDLLGENQRLQLDRQVAVAVGRTELFEVIQVSPDQLRRWTGRHRWAIEDELPAEFLSGLRERLHCDAVIFAKVTAYRPYPPLTVGWKLHLVNASEPGIVWASDMIFDAGNEAVANSAVSYHRENQTADRTGARPETVLRSPGRFGEYTLAASFGTMQGHEKNN